MGRERRDFYMAIHRKPPAFPYLQVSSQKKKKATKGKEKEENPYGKPTGNPKSVMASFEGFFHGEILDHFLKFTNQRMASRISKSKAKKPLKRAGGRAEKKSPHGLKVEDSEITKKEFLVFIALHLSMELLPRHQIGIYWEPPTFLGGSLFYRPRMSLERWCEIFRSLDFDVNGLGKLVDEMNQSQWTPGDSLSPEQTTVVTAKLLVKPTKTGRADSPVPEDCEDEETPKDLAFSFTASPTEGNGTMYLLPRAKEAQKVKQEEETKEPKKKKKTDEEKTKKKGAPGPCIYNSVMDILTKDFQHGHRRWKAALGMFYIHLLAHNARVVYMACNVKISPGEYLMELLCGLAPKEHPHRPTTYPKLTGKCFICHKKGETRVTNTKCKDCDKWVHPEPECFKDPQHY